MQVQSINGFATDPIILRKKASNQSDHEQQDKKPVVVNGAVRQKDGTWIEKSVNNTTGEVILTTTKYNWSNSGVLDSTEVTHIPLTVNEEASKDGKKSYNIPTEGVKKIVDFEHNAVSKGVVSEPLRENFTRTLETIKKDPVTGTESKITYKPSNVPGIYNVSETDAAGNTKVITSALQSPDGAIKIVKNMTSLDGTTTSYRYSKDASGNHIRIFNQITDKDGNVLSTLDRTYDKVDENLAFSSINGRHYTIEHKGKDTLVTDEFMGKTTVLNEESLKLPKGERLEYTIVTAMGGYSPEKTDEPVIETLLHTLPGDTLLKMNDDVKYIIPLKYDIDSAFMGYYGFLNVNTDEFVVSHELGHSQDAYLDHEVKEIEKEIKQAEKEGKEKPKYYDNPIADNPQFVKEYVAEKAAFIKAFPSFQEEFIDYFLFAPDERLCRGRKETVAESNAMNSQKPMPLEELAMRTQVLQQYFPRSIAVATKLMNPIAIPEKTNEHAEILLPPEKEIIVPERKIILL
ncbi:hypothetical protein IJG14_09170 [bacterium]|nr:hypothetical protein [bacterium]